MYSRNLIVRQHAQTDHTLCGMCGKICDAKPMRIQIYTLYLCDFCHKKLTNFPWYNILFWDELKK